MDKQLKKIRTSAKVMSILCKVLNVIMCVCAILTLISAVWLTIDPSGAELSIGSRFLLRAPISYIGLNEVTDATAELYGQFTMYVFLILILLNVENMFASIVSDSDVFKSQVVKTIRNSGILMFVLSIIVPCVESTVSKLLGGSGEASGYGTGLFVAAFLIIAFSSIMKHASAVHFLETGTNASQENADINGQSTQDNAEKSENSGSDGEQSFDKDSSDGKSDSGDADTGNTSENEDNINL